jgi:hypothetical protein
LVVLLPSLTPTIAISGPWHFGGFKAAMMTSVESFAIGSASQRDGERKRGRLSRTVRRIFRGLEAEIQL